MRARHAYRWKRRTRLHSIRVRHGVGYNIGYLFVSSKNNLPFLHTHGTVGHYNGVFGTTYVHRLTLRNPTLKRATKCSTHVQSFSSHFSFFSFSIHNHGYRFKPVPRALQYKLYQDTKYISGRRCKRPDSPGYHPILILSFIVVARLMSFSSGFYKSTQY
eukprot:IDg18657t1